MALDLDETLFDCRTRQVAVALDVAPGVDAEAFWAAMRMGATTRVALAAQRRDVADAAAAAWVTAIEAPEWLRVDSVLPGVPWARG